MGIRPYTALALFFLMIVPSILHADTDADITRASQLHQEAVRIEGGWTTTEKYIKQAKSALKNNKKARAKALAAKALAHASRSLDQAKQQRENWHEPKYIRQ